MQCVLLEAADYCRDIGAIFTETSALNAAGVNQLFTDISKCQLHPCFPVQLRLIFLNVVSARTVILYF